MTNAVNLAAIAPNVSTGGQLAVAGINATGTPSSTTYLRGDGTWSAPAGGVTTFIGQTGAVDPTVLGNLGSIVCAYYTVTSPTTVAGRTTVANYNPGTAVAGSSLAYNIFQTIATSGGNANLYADNPGGYIYMTLNGFTASRTFPVSGVPVGGSVFVATFPGLSWSYTSNRSSNNTCTYTTLSGSWKNLNTFNVVTNGDGCLSYSAVWGPAMWQRYA